MVARDLCQRIDEALGQSVRWDLVDDVLLKLCQTYPTHELWNQVNVKVAVIGRTYATGVERAFKGRSGQGDALTKVVDYMHANGRVVDKIVGNIPDRIDVLTEGAIASVIEGHSRLLKLLSECEHCNRGPRSFVSKYLHLHRPIVPIYDSYVVAVMPRLLGMRVRSRAYPAEIDAVYAAYVEKFWRVNQQILDAGRKCTVKQIDTYLLWEAHR